MSINNKKSFLMTDSKVPVLDPLSIGAFQDRIIVFPDEAETKTKGGIIIPDTVKEKPKKGTVVLIGDDVTEPIKVGDSVSYGKYSGQVIEINSIEFDAIRPNDGIIYIRKGKTESDAVVAQSGKQKATMTTSVSNIY